VGGGDLWSAASALSIRPVFPQNKTFEVYTQDAANDGL